SVKMSRKALERPGLRFGQARAVGGDQTDPSGSFRIDGLLKATPLLGRVDVLVLERQVHLAEPVDRLGVRLAPGAERMRKDARVAPEDLQAEVLHPLSSAVVQRHLRPEEVEMEDVPVLIAPVPGLVGEGVVEDEDTAVTLRARLGGDPEVAPVGTDDADVA